MTATFLHAQQFDDAFVELVVAYAGDVELHFIERLD